MYDRQQPTASNPRVSVVIPTLGGDCVRKTVERLNAGSIVPDEILVCIPSQEHRNFVAPEFENVRVVATNCRGQVAQRAVGFQQAKHDYVLQMDDDILLERDGLAVLISAMKLTKAEAAIAPCFILLQTGESYYKRPRNTFLLNLYYRILNGKSKYQRGTLTMAFTNVGYEPVAADSEVFESEWLPGGCVLHRKQNLETSNFYAFPGKAYCEDIFHSLLLRSKGIRLYFAKEAWATVDQPANSDQTSILNQSFRSYRARRKLLEMYPEGRSLWRLNAFYIIAVCRASILRLRSLGRRLLE